MMVVVWKQLLTGSGSGPYECCTRKVTTASLSYSYVYRGPKALAFNWSLVAPTKDRHDDSVGVGRRKGVTAGEPTVFYTKRN